MHVYSRAGTFYNRMISLSGRLASPRAFKVLPEPTVKRQRGDTAISVWPQSSSGVEAACQNAREATAGDG